MAEQAPPDPDPGATGFPTPETLGAWELVLPGAAERLMKIAEAQTVRIVEAREAANKDDRALARESLRMAFGLALLLIVAAIVFFALGNNLAGGLLLGVPSTGVAVAFVPKAIAERRGPPD